MASNTFKLFPTHAVFPSKIRPHLGSCQSKFQEKRWDLHRFSHFACHFKGFTEFVSDELGCSTPVEAAHSKARNWYPPLNIHPVDPGNDGSRHWKMKNWGFWDSESKQFKRGNTPLLLHDQMCLCTVQGNQWRRTSSVDDEAGTL